ncbi:DNA-binding transcriptional regulator, AcrR family [Asanoa hainanensis]|uniref:DNA-binding transcriptional regulator, AcrR family n=1 Tax=Asanoa hainanensis TaxID=560556 RepID=A0A239I5Q9_9ACTN|nr:TetR/AcrR family transcriptional regulator [Asanoa hainanensis]SNS88702.1 DNA-binding transcriptional regulator, AcrR family [Asanoa hainanensis]
MVGTPSRADARRNHERVLAAARELFARHGLSVTVPQVAELAGVGRATVYRSYPAKDDLVLAIAQERFQRLDDRTIAALTDPDPYAALCAFVPDLFTTLAQDRGLAEAFFAGQIAPAADLLHQLTRLVEYAKPSGRIRPDLTELDLRVILCGPIRQLIVLDQWDERVWRRYAGMVLDALRPTRAGEATSG